jgi:hypothetical protein
LFGCWCNLFGSKIKVIFFVFSFIKVVKLSYRFSFVSIMRSFLVDVHVSYFNRRLAWLVFFSYLINSFKGVLCIESFSLHRFFGLEQRRLNHHLILRLMDLIRNRLLVNEVFYLQILIDLLRILDKQILHRPCLQWIHIFHMDLFVY